jgi:hypothetical protein
VFELYIEGQSGSSAIAQELNRAGFRTRRGKKFTRKAVLDILRNPMYRGQFKWQKEVFKSPHEPIVSKETFEAAGAILQKRSDEGPGKRWHNQDGRILSGLVHCGCCRSRMFGVSARGRTGQKVPYYVCSKRLNTQECDMAYMRAYWLEQQILADIQTVFRRLSWRRSGSRPKQLANAGDRAEIQAVDHRGQGRRPSTATSGVRAGTMAPRRLQPAGRRTDHPAPATGRPGRRPAGAADRPGSACPAHRFPA